MGLFNEVKKFVGKLLKNPLKTGVVAYLIWTILKKNLKEDFDTKIESIKVIKTDKDKQLVFDIENEQYAVIRGRKIKFFKSLNDAEKDFKEGINMKEKVYKEKLKELKEKFEEGEETVEQFKEKVFKEQNDPPRICGHLWFDGTENQRKAFGKGTEGRGRDAKPPKEWWDDCIKTISNAKR